MKKFLRDKVFSPCRKVILFTQSFFLVNNSLKPLHAVLFYNVMHQYLTLKSRFVIFNTPLGIYAATRLAGPQPIGDEL